MENVLQNFWLSTTLKLTFEMIDFVLQLCFGLSLASLELRGHNARDLDCSTSGAGLRVVLECVTSELAS